VLRVRTPGRTDRPAINLRRLHANKENTIEPPIPSTERFIVLVRIHSQQYRSAFGGCLAVFGHGDFWELWVTVGAAAVLGPCKGWDL